MSKNNDLLRDLDAAHTATPEVKPSYQSGNYDVHYMAAAGGTTTTTKIVHKGIYTFTNLGTKQHLSYYWNKKEMNLPTSVGQTQYTKTRRYTNQSPPNVATTQYSTSIYAKWRLISHDSGENDCFSVYNDYFYVNTYRLDYYVGDNAVLYRDYQYNNENAVKNDIAKTQKIKIEYNNDGSVSIYNMEKKLYLTAAPKPTGVKDGEYSDQLKDGVLEGRTKDTYGNVFWEKENLKNGKRDAHQKWTPKKTGDWIIHENPENIIYSPRAIPKFKYAGKGYRKRYEASTAQTPSDTLSFVSNYLKASACRASNDMETIVTTDPKTNLVLFKTPYLPCTCLGTEDTNYIPCYIAAMGSYYQPHYVAYMGTFCYVELTNGTKFYIFCGDMKDDIHTNDANLNEAYFKRVGMPNTKSSGDPLHMYTTASLDSNAVDPTEADNYNHTDSAYEFCSIKFFLETRDLTGKKLDFMNDGGVIRKIASNYKTSEYAKFFAELKMVKRLNFTLFNDQEWYGEYRQTQNFADMYAERG